MSMFSKLTKYILLTGVLSLSSCQSASNSNNTINNGDINYDVTENFKGHQIFDNYEEIEIIFFDTENVVSPDGESYTSRKKLGYNLGATDCYMIKMGNIEILVDGGFQVGTRISYSSDNKATNYLIEENCRNNLLPKIASVCEDGILDFVIVTHADFDHIASLTIEGGIFDAFCTNRKDIKPLGKQIEYEFKYIKNIIDFDSSLVEKYSKEDLKNKLISSKLFTCYRNKRNEVINKSKEYVFNNSLDDCINYCPAASFFSSNDDFSVEKKDKAMPSKLESRLKKLMEENTSNGRDFYILSGYEEFVNDPNYINFKDVLDNYKNKYNGALTKVSNQDDSIYYYTINISDDIELRILYNWYYDYIFRGNFNNNAEDTNDPTDPKFDSQDANNLSVLFQIVNKKVKYLGIGDLGGNGEDGLLKYYGASGILENIGCVKASHHGSTKNQENSLNLYNVLKSKVNIITGTMQLKDSNENTYLANRSSPVVTKEYFDNVLNSNPDSFILCTNITSYNDQASSFEAVPFYGDIRVSCTQNNITVGYSYVGVVGGYVNKKINNGYNISFKVNKKSLQNTEWYKEAKDYMIEKKEGV